MQEIYAEGPANPGRGASEVLLQRFAEEMKRCEPWANFLDSDPARRTLWEGFKKALHDHYTEKRASGLLPPGAPVHLTNHSFLVSGHKPGRDARDVPEQLRHGDLRAPGVQCGVQVSEAVRLTLILTVIVHHPQPAPRAGEPSHRGVHGGVYRRADAGDVGQVHMRWRERAVCCTKR